MGFVGIKPIQPGRGAFCQTRSPEWFVTGVLGIGPARQRNRSTGGSPGHRSPRQCMSIIRCPGPEPPESPTGQLLQKTRLASWDPLCIRVVKTLIPQRNGIAACCLQELPGDRISPVKFARQEATSAVTPPRFCGANGKSGKIG